MPTYSASALGSSGPGVLAPLNATEAIQSLQDFALSDHARFPTGWSIDDSCGMTGEGEMALVWARSSAGKSTLMLNAVANTPAIPTVIFNMEMPPRMQAQWLLTMTEDLEVGAFDMEKVVKAGHDDPRWPELRDAFERFPQTFPSLHFVQPSRPSVLELDIVLDDVEDSTGEEVKRVFIDHAGLMVEEESYQSFNRVLGDLHSWAMRRNICLWVVQQTKRTADGGNNDGHMPLSLSSGVFAGEAHADWIFGLYRPERNPKFRKTKWDFKSPEDYMQMLADRERVRGLSILQVIKNRVFGAVNEDGIELTYDTHTRRLSEGTTYA